MAAILSRERWVKEMGKSETRLWTALIHLLPHRHGHSGWCGHYNDVIMGPTASQITSLTTVNSTVYSDADKKKHQSSASLTFVRGIHRGPVNSPHKWPVTRKMFPFDDVIIHLLPHWHGHNGWCGVVAFWSTPLELYIQLSYCSYGEANSNIEVIQYGFTIGVFKPMLHHDDLSIVYSHNGACIIFVSNVNNVHCSLLETICSGKHRKINLILQQQYSPITVTT